MKDKFSSVAKQYASYRPVYPERLLDFIIMQCPDKNSAWDCGTGNGQVALKLSKHFQTVYATDISQNQIEHAFRNDNITYKVEAGENCSFPDQSFDLITVAQAVHWFDFDQFYKEVYRTLRPGGNIAIFGYGLIRIDEPINRMINELYYQTLKSHWDDERKYIDEEYRTIPFPFEELNTPDFKVELVWNANQFIGYLNTWSGLINYRKLNSIDPIIEFQKQILLTWEENVFKNIEFPVFLRMGKLKS